MKVLIGITGSISAYKILTLIRMFKKSGHEVKVILTEAGSKFIPTLAIKSFGVDYYTDQFSENIEQPIHVYLSKWADILLIAPASMNTLSKMALGICDNLLLSTFFVFNKKVIIAPAMNNNMYSNSAFQKNLLNLKKNGVIEIPPKSGDLASYDKGRGLLEEVDTIYEEVDNYKNYNERFKGKNILITAGGSSEEIDPVRIISNRSTGTMGREIALGFYRSGANVKIISSVNLKLPSSIEIIAADSVDDFLKQSKKLSKWYNIYISAAALSDFIPHREREKIKKQDFKYTLNLKGSADVLQEMVKNKKSTQFIIGFAAETDIDIAKIKNKFKNKKVDLIVVNKISKKRGFGPKKADGYFLYEKNNIKFSGLTKHDLTIKLLKVINE
ncbi:bifunctional phosphopantothenoylcysteine decarboxylase/phosphopantothenate--cysteine ligase CoaBC [bacterium]|nr:bifunctional phosphopantothenoylcysteine decarboxylase/phosphopantothenate--cysteine ligase CoaBC [bacterium]